MLHHVELWVPDLAGATGPWGWLLGELGWKPYQEWPGGRSWLCEGVYLVLEQSPVVLMDSSTIGIPAGSSESYHKDVHWDTRVTWSGEYVHAAPWSVDEQGIANVSHGCTGMSTANAHWFYDTVRRGDVVQVVNSYGHRMETFSNGFGDWNLSWDDWLKGSALGRPVSTGAVSGPVSTPVGYLRPQA